MIKITRENYEGLHLKELTIDNLLDTINKLWGVIDRQDKKLIDLKTKSTCIDLILEEMKKEKQMRNISEREGK